jgi:hypothetical protein
MDVLLDKEAEAGGDRYARMTERSQRGQVGPAGNGGGSAAEIHG